MLDLKLIRNEADRVRAGLTAKGGADLDSILDLDRRMREILQDVEVQKAERNKSSEEIARRKKTGEDAGELLDRMKDLSERIKSKDAELKEVERDLGERMRWIPNLPHGSVPVGDASANREVRRWGELPGDGFRPKPHYEIGEELGLLDFGRASKISGSGFAVFTGWGARLQRALIQYFLDTGRDRNGFTEVSTPFIVRRDAMFGTGQIPKLEEDMYRTEPDDFFLIPTAEVSITNLWANEQLGHEELPLYRMGYSPCFRREAGTYGKETRGLVRVHQFDKVELVKIVEPETSYDELESLVKCVEELLQSLELPYRVLELATGDLSFAAAKCYDLEVWAHAERRWLEVSSCSNFEDFQARRMNLRYRNADKKLVYPHTLNGSGLALPRIIVALLENNQTDRGTVRVPDVLRPYLGGREELGA
ncbi:MAG: serine--tRNA ligase [Candidatus Eisenbacteria bacterium]|uniref:Serine--tRNA ligase n=1 Tax=Eiseniibacteriota bacterium TaxID=2212470 RepID=A0A956RR53_UNCEI|nr:serine--tRNA ligase [Candidatus Eisenbacteria bacterium]